MKNNNKSLGIILISVILISCIFAHTFFLTSNIPLANDNVDENDLIELNSAQLNEFYECDPLNNLTIDADPDNNETTATIKTFGDEGEEEVTLYSKSNKTDTITKLGSLEFKSDDSKTYVNETGPQVEYEAEIDHTFTNNSLELDIQDNEIYSEAKGDSVNNRLESFYLMIYNETTELNATFNYDLDSPDGYALELFIEHPIHGTVNFLIDYNSSLNEFKWTLKGYPLSFPVYVINASGAWADDTQISNWVGTSEYMRGDPLTEVFIDEIYNILAVSLTNITDDLFMMIFTKASNGIITMKFSSLFVESLSFHWNLDVISVYFGIGTETMIITYYIENIVNLLYIFIWELWVVEIKFYWTVVLIDLYIYKMDIWKVIETNILRWDFFLNFAGWLIEIQYFYNISSLAFYDYFVYLQYSTFYYFYHVPTIILPNYLRITIPEERYTDTTFLIVLLVTDLQENPIDDATIEGTWDGITLQQGVNVTNNGDGTYDINITAILVPPGGVPIWLNLTASRNGYANGTLNTGIAVDPDTVNSVKIPPPPPELTLGSVDPKKGDQNTQFTFTVNYTNEDNYAPIYVNVTINNTSYKMFKQDDGDEDYTDGCIYYFTTTLAPAAYNYTYYFECSDGIGTPITTETWDDLYVYRTVAAVPPGDDDDDDDDKEVEEDLTIPLILAGVFTGIAVIAIIVILMKKGIIGASKVPREESSPP